jgi:hypothetical protein
VDTVSTARGSGWWVNDQHAITDLNADPPATAGGTDLVQVEDKYEC